MNVEVEIAPIRSLDDFLLESARFQIPNYKDLDKWSNRVCSNLLYYQTNYFFMAIIVFLLIGFVHPVKMICGILAICAAFGLFCYITNSKRSASKFKRDHPVISLIVIFSGGYFVVYMLSSVLVFLFGIMLPIACAYFVGFLISSVLVCLFGLMLPLFLMFIHASMRLRNLRNKVVNKIEAIGVKKTPMGLFLEALGQEHTAIS